MPHFSTFDPGKKLIDMIAFDGTSNVQKADMSLCNLYPRCTFIHGREHVISLICGDICKLPAIYDLINTNKVLYQFYASSHASYYD